MQSNTSPDNPVPCNRDPGINESAEAYFPGNGMMIRTVREKDWTGTLLGPVSTWPESIRTAVDICLNSHFQLVVLCGPELVYVYNDAAIPIFGDKHPWALGQRASDVWAEAWDTIGPMLHAVLDTGIATRHDDLLLVLQRRGFIEECYFTFSYSPIRIEGGAVGGVFVAVLETTERVVNERRQRTLSDLATQVARSHGQPNNLARLREALSRNPYDLPFASLYLVDGAGECARPVFCAGLADSKESAVPPASLRPGGPDSDHPVARAVQTGTTQRFTLQKFLGDKQRCGAWPEQPTDALAVPFRLPGQAAPRGVLVVGINPRKELDKEYAAFFDLAAGHIATAVANAEAAELERKRIDAIEQLDRSKSAFFSNASHELRTPVTLILGPLEDILQREEATLAPAVKEQLEMACRNARTLHRLVNSIMDFAGIEAGRLLAKPEPTDIGMLTAETASLFRSAIESEGLELSVDCDALGDKVLIDRGMWEKIVLNLVSNASKFTLKGRIEVLLKQYGDAVCLAVRDTGVGIASGDMPRIFERFFRGQAQGGRSVEGSGIGLAVVHELVRLHDGHIHVESTPGRGSTFSVRIPLRVETRLDAGNRLHAQPRKERHQSHANDATRIVPRNGETTAVAYRMQARTFHADPPDKPSNARMRVLVIDDNEDIVRYIRRLLSDTCVVISAQDARSGLEAAHRYSPDLILTDVMMPGLDGFGLLRAIRADEATQTTSLIMLSARAGEDARLEALEAGADDYLVKPFSARELIARVHSHIQMKRARHDAAECEGELRRQIAEVQGDLNRVLECTNAAYVSLDHSLRLLALNQTAAWIFDASKQKLTGRMCADVPALGGSKLELALRRAIKLRLPVSEEYFHRASSRWFIMRCYPAPQGVIVFGDDITERKQAEQTLRMAHAQLECSVAARTQALQEASKLLAAVFDRAPGGIAITDVEGNFVRANAAYQKLVGYSEEELLSRTMENLTHPDDYESKKSLFAQLLRGECHSFEMELRYIRSDGRTIWVNNFMSTIDDEAHRLRYFVKIAQDITDRKRAEQEILSSQAALRTLYERLQTVREEERVALAREVHDQLGQVLSAAKIDIKLLEDDVRTKGASLSRRRISVELRSARRSLDEAIRLVRDIATELRAPVIEEQGLYEAIRWHARDFERRTRIRCSVTLPHDLQQPRGAIAVALFRIFQESMTNVLRHAKASQVWVSLARRGRSVLLRVRDDGVGLSPRRARSAHSIGLAGMRERAALAKGRLVVGRLRTGGTLVSARMPLEEENDRFDPAILLLPAPQEEDRK